MDFNLTRLEEDLTPEERQRAWDVAYGALHWGNPKARPIVMDQAMLIAIVAELLKQIDEA